MPYSFHFEQWLPYPTEQVFAFFADPANLPQLMPPRQAARIDRLHLVPALPNPQPNAAGPGTRVLLSFRPLPVLPIRVQWEAEITEFVWNDFFADRQVRGPFALWNHRHSVRPLTSATTVLTDDVQYDLPLGPFGRLAHTLFVRRQIEAAFAYRREALMDALQQPNPRAATPKTRAS
jgi:ligand-binding SRPBCC domain-containing protein